MTVVLCVRVVLATLDLRHSSSDADAVDVPLVYCRDRVLSKFTRLPSILRPYPRPDTVCIATQV